MSFQFEWDEGKRLSNLSKHGVDFYDAALIFSGETFEVIDNRGDYDEERIVAFGHVEGQVLRVVYTLRDKSIRIITAQKANRHDREKYYAIVFSG